MIDQAAIATFNHLLAQSSWARARLRPFAGRTALLATEALALRITIDAEGGFAEASADTPVDAEVRVPLSALPHAMQGFESLTRHVEVSGNAEFAEALGFVLRNLRWDAEEDLARVVGDIAARRIAQGAASFFEWQKHAARTLAQSTADYLAEERPVLLRPAAMEAFGSEVDTLRDDLARLEKRVERLERH